jgi:hypothetical protein
MSLKLGSFVDEGNGGKPNANDDPGTLDANSDRISGPEKIDEPVYVGFEPIEHATERISDLAGSDERGGDPEPRRTKSGRVDGRTLRWKRTAKTGTEEKEVQDTVSVGGSKLSLTDLLLTIHMMGEEILKVEGLSLDRDEAQKLSKAIQEVQKHYNVTFDPKKIAIANLIAAAGSIYIPRFIAWSNDARKNKPAIVQTINEPPARPQHEQRRNPEAGMMTPSQLWPEHG